MKLFFLAQRVPYPPDRGDKITTFNEIRHLAERHEVEVFSLAEGREDLDAVASLKKIVSDVHAVPLNSVSAKFRALSAVARGAPFTPAYFSEPALHRMVERRFRAARPDLIMVYGSGMAQYAEPFTGAPRLMQFAELDSAKWAQYAATILSPMRALYKLEAKRLLEYERHIAETFSHSLVCTRREQDDFERLIPGARVTCVPNGVDLDYFRPRRDDELEDSLVFTGVMDYRPNVDAVEWFCAEILPHVREAIPSVRLAICGSRPNRRVRSLARLTGVSVTGRVPDVRPYLDRASVAVLPLRLARGIQNKLLEAMAAGLPCVATSAAITGVNAEPGRDLLAADEPSLFAAAIIRLLGDASLRRNVGAAARAAMERNYRWETHLGLLDSIVEAEIEAFRAALPDAIPVGTVG